MSLFPSIFFVPFPLIISLCMENTTCVLSFRMVFFYLVTTGRISDISLCENSTNSKYIHICIIRRDPSREGDAIWRQEALLAVKLSLVRPKNHKERKIPQQTSINAATARACVFDANLM